MPTWDETREHLRSKYKLLHDDENWVGLGFAFMRDGKALSQRLRVEPCPIYGVPGVMMWCDVMDAALVPANIALVRNMAFPIGALANHDGLMVLITSLPLDGIVWDTFDVIIENLAKDAARLRDDAPSTAA